MQPGVPGERFFRKVVLGAVITIQSLPPRPATSFSLPWEEGLVFLGCAFALCSGESAGGRRKEEDCPTVYGNCPF